MWCWITQNYSYNTLSSIIFNPMGRQTFWSFELFMRSWIVCSSMGRQTFTTMAPQIIQDNIVSMVKIIVLKSKMKYKTCIGIFTNIFGTHHLIITLILTPMRQHYSMNIIFIFQMIANMIMNLCNITSRFTGSTSWNINSKRKIVIFNHFLQLKIIICNWKILFVIENS
jgi:hypothetical protein